MTEAEDFEAWWLLVWRKVGKGAARKAFSRARKLVSQERLCEAATAFKEKLIRLGTEEQYQPHPSTWLNAERWLDEEPRPTIEQKIVSNTEHVFKRVQLALKCREIMIDRQEVMLALRAGKITQEDAKRLGL